MSDLTQMKKKWKILDENLQKTDIIYQEQIKKIMMGKIQTTFEAWRKKSKFSLIVGSVITVVFSLQWFLQGYIWQAVSYFSIMLVLIILSLMERKEMKMYDVYSLPTFKLLEKVENLQLRKQREQLLGIPIIVLMIFVIASISEFKIWTLVGFVSACVVAFVIGYIRMQRNFKKLRENLQELKDKQEESE